MRRGPSTYWPTLGRGSWTGTPWGVWVGVWSSSQLNYPFGKGPGQRIIRCLQKIKCENEQKSSSLGFVMSLGFCSYVLGVSYCVFGRVAFCCFKFQKFMRTHAPTPNPAGVPNGRFWATLLLRTTRMRSQRLGGVSGEVALQTIKQTKVTVVKRWSRASARMRIARRVSLSRTTWRTPG